MVWKTWSSSSPIILWKNAAIINKSMAIPDKIKLICLQIFWVSSLVDRISFSPFDIMLNLMKVLVCLKYLEVIFNATFAGFPYRSSN